MEYGDKGPLLGLASVIVWLLTSLALGWGWLACIMGQVGIFAALTGFNLWRDRKKRS